MPLPHARAKQLKEVPQIGWSGLCCIQADNDLDATLVPSAPVSARPMSEVAFTPRTPRMSESRYKPRIPAGPSAGLYDQLLAFERRLQNSIGESIAFIMEQQYQKLSCELLDIMRSSPQKGPLEKASVYHASAGANGFSVKFTPSTDVAAEDTRPLLKLGKNAGAVAPVTVNDSPNPPLIASPRGAKSLNGHSELPGISQKASDPTGSAVLTIGPVGTETNAIAVTETPTEFKWSHKASTCANGSKASTRTTGSKKAGRQKLESAMAGDSTILSDLLHAEHMRKRERQVETNMKSKFKKQKGQMRNSLTGELDLRALGMDILHSPLFDSMCALAILLNAVLIGCSVEWLTTHDEETMVLIILANLCNLFFLFELLFRLFVYRLRYFNNEDWAWNNFDFALVSFSVVDFVIFLTIGSSGGSVGSTLKIMKMLRIVRIVRVFRFFKELSLLAVLIMDSLRSLMWTMLMLMIIIYIFAIGFTQNATEFLKNLEGNEMSEVDNNILELFGSLPRTIYSLVYAMLGGRSWGEMSDPLMHMDAFSAILFFFYICFTVLAVLNIITGVFVDNAVETAKVQREFLIQKEIELREKLLADMRQLFAEMDEDKSGSVSFEELHSFFEDERVQTYFQALGLDVSDAERLFRLIDTDDSGEVQVDEFLDGCLRLKGEARSIDVNTILWQCRNIQTRLDKLEGELIVEQGGVYGDKQMNVGWPKPNTEKGDGQAVTSLLSVPEARPA